MGSNVRLSILIPAYNPGKWLKGILDVLKQQIEKYPCTEVVIVDDGSTEDVSYASRYMFVKLWMQANHGEPSARNMLLYLSQGEYIQFIDADDEIYPNCLDVVYSNIEEGYDFVSYEFDTDHNRKRSYHNYGQLMTNCAMWGYTFKKSIFKGNKFNEVLLTGCDTDILQRVLKDDMKHKHDDRVFYNYRWDGNESSLCHKKLRGEI